MEIPGVRVCEQAAPASTSNAAKADIPFVPGTAGWSHNTAAAVMVTKASAISGLLRGKAAIDADSSADGITEYG